LTTYRNYLNFAPRLTITLEMIKGVITGDIINSTKLDVSSYQSLTSSINETISELASLSAMSIDFFRGDSFQIIVDSPSAAIKIAILLRATIKSHAHQSWDARLSVGSVRITLGCPGVIVQW